VGEKLYSLSLCPLEIFFTIPVCPLRKGVKISTEQGADLF